MASVLVIPLCLLDYVCSGLLLFWKVLRPSGLCVFCFLGACLFLSPGTLLSWGRVGCPLLYPQVHLAGYLSVLSRCVAFAR